MKVVLLLNWTFSKFLLLFLLILWDKVSEPDQSVGLHVDYLVYQVGWDA